MINFRHFSSIDFGNVFYSILLKFGSKKEPKWLHKSFQNPSKIEALSPGSISGALGSFWHHFGTRRCSFSRALGSFLHHFGTLLVCFSYPFEAFRYLGTFGNLGEFIFGSLILGCFCRESCLDSTCRILRRFRPKVCM